MLKELFANDTKLHVENETLEILRLIRSENVGTRTFFELLKIFGTPKLALENIKDFALRGGRSKPINVCSKNDAEKELELLSKNKANIITYKSPKFSRLLLEIADFPPIITYKGNIDLLNFERIIAIVGARNASANGRFFASKIAKELIMEDYITVSGLARGIDTAVHEVNVTKTIGVIAGGIDHIYPIENTRLYERMASEGLIIAELPIGSKPLSQHFPQRNRLISGLALAVVVVEASLRSGSLITARFALEQNRDIFSVPGFPLDPRCQGTNKLIREGAYLMESSQDIISQMIDHNRKNIVQSFEAHGNNDNNLSFFPNVDIYVSDEMRKSVMDLLSASPIDIGFLIKELNFDIRIIYTIILELELAGRITRYPANKIALIYK